MRFSSVSGSNYITFIIALANVGRDVIRENLGLTLSQYRLLADIERDKGIAKIADLKSRLNLSTSSISMIVSDLEVKGLVTKEDGYEDSRVVKIKITPGGKQAIRSGDKAISEAETEFLRPGKVYFDMVSPEAKAQYIAKLGKGRSLPHSVHLSYSRIESMIICEKALQKMCLARDLTTLEYRILLLLSENDCISRLSDLARLLLTKPANLAIAIKSLKKAGSVVRSRDNIDRRSAFLEMTTEGYAIWRDIDKEIGEFLENYTSEFAEEELDLSYKVMNLCVEKLQEQYCVV